MEANNKSHSSKTLGIVCAAALLLIACARKDVQQSFSSPDAAFEALITGLEKGETASLSSLLGSGVE